MTSVTRTLTRSSVELRPPSRQGPRPAFGRIVETTQGRPWDLEGTPSPAPQRLWTGARGSQGPSGRPATRGTIPGHRFYDYSGEGVNSFSQMGSHPSFLIGKLCRSAFSLILARSFWTGRDVSSAEVRGLQESLARLPSPFEVPVARKEEPDDADKAFTTSLIHLLRTSRKSAVTRSMRSEGPCELAEVSGTFGWDS